MTIHHATAKKAEKADVTLTEIDLDGGPGVAAEKLGITFTHPQAKVALAAVLFEHTLRAEYPALTLEIDPEDGTWLVRTRGGDDVLEADELPDLADVLEACEELGIDPETGNLTEVDEEEEIEYRGSIVPAKYRELYAERGNPNHCGDWIASKLEGVFEGPEGFEVDVFTAFLRTNGVDLTGRWASLPYSGQKGAVGRYRMNGRLKLERRLADTGVLVMSSLGKKDVKLPDDVLGSLRAKYLRSMTKKPHPSLNYVRPDEVAETWNGVSKPVQKELWAVLDEHGKPFTPEQKENMSPGDALGHDAVSKFWRHLSTDAKLELNVLAEHREV